MYDLLRRISGEQETHGRPRRVSLAEEFSQRINRRSSGLVAFRSAFEASPRGPNSPITTAHPDTNAQPPTPSSAASAATSSPSCSPSPTPPTYTNAPNTSAAPSKPPRPPSRAPTARSRSPALPRPSAPPSIPPTRCCALCPRAPAAICPCRCGVPGAGDPIDVCHPIGVEIYRPDPALLYGWEAPQVAAYCNLHELRAPRWGES
jgi:hypothetical protein